MNCTRNWRDTEASGPMEKLPPGGYVCAVTGAWDVPDKQYLRVEFDIVDGPMRGFYTELRKRVEWNVGYFILSYKDSAASIFKHFLSRIEASNPGFKADEFNNDERALQGKYIGLVLFEEEYQGSDGAVKTRITRMPDYCSVEDIRAGAFKLPPLKKLKNRLGSGGDPGPVPPPAGAADFDEIAGDDDLPF